MNSFTDNIYKRKTKYFEDSPMRNHKDWLRITDVKESIDRDGYDFTQTIEGKTHAGDTEFYFNYRIYYDGNYDTFYENVYYLQGDVEENRELVDLAKSSVCSIYSRAEYAKPRNFDLLEVKNKRVDGKVTYYLSELLYLKDFTNKFIVDDIHSEVKIKFKNLESEDKLLQQLEKFENEELHSIDDSEILNLNGLSYDFPCTSLDNFLDAYAFYVMAVMHSRSAYRDIIDTDYNDFEIEIKIHNIYKENIEH